jgi:hypothetical protein
MTAKVEWIVCDGAERPVIDGRVDCPRQQALTARPADVVNCLLCRHLMATPIDREWQGECSTDAPSAAER